MIVPETDPLSQLSLPPGFRFYPTDEELLVQYLCRKVAGHQFSLQIIGEIDLYKFDPWVLPSKAIFGEKEWYFFSPRDRKYPNGSRPNRVAGSGYWKATGTDKVITTEGRKVGIKKALVFYVGKAPKGSKTNWIMHEYRLFEPSRKNGSAKLDEWVLCRIYKKNSSSAQKVPMSSSSITGQEQSYNSSSSSSSHLDDVLESLPEIEDRFFSLPRMNSLKNLQNGLGSGNFDWATLAGLTSEPELLNAGQQSQSHQTQGMIVNNNNNNNNNCSNDVYVPSIPPLCNVDSPPQKLRNKVEEEAQSGLRTQQQQQQQHQAAANLGLFQQNSNIFNQSFPNSFDSFGFRYPTQSNGFGLFRQ